MNHLTRYLLLFALLCGVSFAAEIVPVADATPAYSVSADFTYASRYVFRGIELTGPSLQPSVKVTAGDFYAGLWVAQSAQNRLDTEGDFNAGYNVKLTDAWTLDGGATAYTYPHDRNSSTFEPYVGANGSYGALSTSVYVYRDTVLSATTVQGTLGYEVELGKRATLDFSGNVGRVTGSSLYTYGGAGATLALKVTEKVTVTGGTQYATHNLRGVPTNRTWFTVGVTFDL